MRFGGARARLRPGAGGACMRWFVKAAAFNVLSAAPAGERLYHLLQDRVTRSTRVTEEGLRERIDLADWYLDVLEAERPRGLDGLRHVDIGAGWMPTIPLVFYAAGVDRQVLCDISRHLRIERVAEVVRAVRDLAGREPRLAVRGSRLPSPQGCSGGSSGCRPPAFSPVPRPSSSPSGVRGSGPSWSRLLSGQE